MFSESINNKPFPQTLKDKEKSSKAGFLKKGVPQPKCRFFFKKALFFMCLPYLIICSKPFGD